MFLFHLKISFYSYDTNIVLLTFFFLYRKTVLIQKNGLIRKVKLNFKIYDVTNWNTNSFIKDCQVSLKVKTIRLNVFFCYWEMHRIYIHRGHPHSTYAQKSPKLDPLPPCGQSYAFGLTLLYAYVLFIYSRSRLPLLTNFCSNSSVRQWQFLVYFYFYLPLRLNSTQPISKRFLWFLFIA